MCEANQKEESRLNAVVNVVRPCSISESIVKSCQEVKMMREGKIPKCSWSEFEQRMIKEMPEEKSPPYLYGHAT